MARTAFTTALVALTRDTGVALGNGQTPDATNGNSVPSPGPFQAQIMIKNADSAAHSLVLRASGYTGTPTGGANSGLVAAYNQIFSQATKGDLTVAVAAGATEVITLSDNDRFVQADGSMWLDWSASTSMTVWVLTRPYVVPA